MTKGRLARKNLRWFDLNLSAQLKLNHTRAVSRKAAEALIRNYGLLLSGLTLYVAGGF
jgi:hypothetical protein